MGAESEQLTVLREWMERAESQAPELVVAIAHAYADSFKSVKMAKAFARGLNTESSKAIAGLPATQWEQRIHASFPELKGYDVILVPKDKAKQQKSMGNHPEE